MKKIKELYLKYKEAINYIIFGVLTTVVSLVVYYLSVFTFLNPENSIQLQIANILSWIAGVTFAYFTNRKYVFESTEKNKIKEASKFVLARVVTLVMDMIIMWLGVTILHLNDKIVKLISQVIIIISNYVFSKLFVFKKEENNKITEKTENKGFGKIVLRIISILFSIFFIIILFNTIFFNRTIAINFKIPVMILGTLLVYLILFGIYYIYKKKKLNFLDYSPKKRDLLCVFFIIFIIQYIFASLTYANNGWDCGGIIGNIYNLLKGENVSFSYYSQYTNNIGMLLLVKYILIIAKAFTSIPAISDAFFAVITFNIIMVDIAALFTFLTIKKVLGNKSAYFSLIFILPFIVFTPYIIIPYTDTMTMAFPITILYLYLNIKELPRKSIKRCILIFIEGILLATGMVLKPTVLIIAISIVIFEILNIKIKNINKTTFIKNFTNLIIVAILFSIGFSLSYMSYSKLKEKTLGKLISKEDYYNNEVSFTHFLMMGMQERQNDSLEEGKNQTLYVAYNGLDVVNTVAVKGYKEKQKYNITIIKERLSNFGVKGYINFLYNKANWILSDGTFFYGQEGTWKVGDYFNQSKIARIAQAFINEKSNTYKKITANIMQITWIILTIGLIFSISKNEDKSISISKLTLIGIILFLLMFEGRARYLINHLPIFIFVGTYGIANSFNKLKKLFKS